MDWPKVISQIAEKHKISQREIGELIGCSTIYVQKIKSGSRKDINYTFGNLLLKLRDSESVQKFKRGDYGNIKVKTISQSNYDDYYSGDSEVETKHMITSLQREIELLELSLNENTAAD